MKAIYKIIDNKNKRIYIGESLNLEYRYYMHKTKLEDGIHSNKKLQKYYNESDFKFEIEVIVGDNIKSHPYVIKMILLLLEKITIQKYQKLGYTVLNQEDSLERVIKGDKKLFNDYEVKNPNKEDMDQLIKQAKEYLKECKLIGNILYKKDAIMISNKDKDKIIKELIQY